MDKKFDCPRMLDDHLRRFINGQFQLRTRFGEIYRGEVSSYSVNGKKVELRFTWFVMIRVVFDKDNSPKLKGEASLVRRNYHTSLVFKKFYFPKSPYARKGDTRRIKGVTEEKEEFRFFLPDDNANLVLDDNGDFYSRTVINLERFKLGVPEVIQAPLQLR